ncbi:MAG: O-antigen ligase family protein, partial [Gemmatimonadota bacterium]|nr:O-antigen ligase family protein [Gemmatimonadota bacterium]
MSRRGNIKKKTSVEPVRHRPESAARGFERTAEWIFYACLVLGATVVAPQDFFDWSEPPKLFTVQVGAAAILCLWLCAAALRGSLRVRLPAVLLPLGFTAVVAVLSVAWSVNPGLAVERLYHVGSLALFLVFALWLYRGQDVKGALYLIIFISAGIALWGLVLDLVDPLRNWVYPNFLEQRGGHWINNIRPLTSTQGNPNFLLHVLVMAVPAALGALVHCLLERQEIVRRTRRVLILALAGSFLLPLACFARSQNRSSLVAVFLALLLFFVISLVINRGQMFSFFQTCRKHAPRFLAGLALAALAAAAAIGFTDRGRSFALSFTSSAQARLAYWGTRFGNLTDLENIDVYSRVVLFETSTAMIADNPLLGKGIGQFQVYYPGYKTVEHWEKFPLLTPEIKRWSEIPAFAHNEWLQVFLELGVFAFASFLLFWILLGLMVLGVLRRSAGDPRFFLVLGIAAAIAGALFNALLTFPLQTITSGMFFWGLVGLLLVQCEVFVPGGRLREFDLTLRIKPVAAKLALAAGAVMILALCTWGSVRIIRSQYLLFDALKNHARRLDYSIRQVDKAERVEPGSFVNL